MTFDDWNHNGPIETEESVAINDTRVFNGTTALEVNKGRASTGEGGVYVWKQSVTDAPTEARVVSYINPAEGHTGGEILWSFIFRYQDINNFYIVTPYTDSFDRSRITLGASINGTAHVIDAIDLGSAWGLVNLSDGAGPINNWNHWRITLWVDDQNNDIRARVEEDADSDGTWTQLGSDLVDTTVRLSGGGVGIAVPADGHLSSASSGSHNTWYDDTEIRY